MKIFLFSLLIIFSCKPELKRNLFEFITFASFSKLHIIYPSSSYAFPVGIDIPAVIPEISGSVTDCTADPPLPNGLVLNSADCTISGKPSALQAFSTYTVTARNSYESASAQLSIAVVSLSDKDIISYSIPSLGLTGIISGTQISLTSDTLASVSSYIASFITTGQKVTAAGIDQTSDITSNSYASNLIYTVTAADGSTKNYTVTLTAPRSYGGSSLVIWLKADSLGLADSTAVASWTDISGVGNTFSQGTVGLRPIFRNNQINGLPAVQFRAASIHVLRILAGGVNLYITNSGTFFIVVKLVSTNASGSTILNLHGSNGREMAVTDPNGPFLQCRNALGCYVISGTPMPLNTYIALGSVQVLMTSQNEIWNGDLKGSVNAGLYDYSGGGAPNTAYLANGFIDMDVAEVLYFNAALSQNDVDKIFCYLRAKYNLTSVNKSCGN